MRRVPRASFVSMAISPVTSTAWARASASPSMAQWRESRFWSASVRPAAACFRSVRIPLGPVGVTANRPTRTIRVPSGSDTAAGRA